jgi:predicted Zn-dependent protease
MIKNDYQNILNIFKKHNIEGFINISTTTSKDLEYSPLHDEISLDNSESTTTSIYVIKNNRKASFKIDSYSLEKIENSINDILKVIDFAETDKDIVLPNISDTIEKDFSNKELDKIDFDFLKNEFNKFKNFNFDEKVTIETFTI